MKLVIIYGMPGVGKLTVARKLAKATGFKLFHNHLTFDLARLIYPVSDKLWKYVRRLRLQFVREAIKADIDGLVYTTCVTEKSDKTIRKIKEICKKHKTKLYFAHLHCSHNAHVKRVKTASRENFGKLRDPKELKQLLEKHGAIVKLQMKHLSIDNTKLSPTKAAKKIKNRYSL